MNLTSIGVFILSFIVYLPLSQAIDNESEAQVCIHCNEDQAQLSTFNFNNADDLFNHCYVTKPTIYNPSINNKLEGGKTTRFSSKHLINPINEALKNGRPVSLSMDSLGSFGKMCNFKNSRGAITRNCLLLVRLEGLDREFPEYRKKFPLLPKDSFLGLVEDTGRAFKNKGTTRMDIPISIGKYYLRNKFVNAKFEVLEQVQGQLSSFRQQDFSNYNPYAKTKQLSCDNQ